ncbi:MAG: hypothetical protein FVQ83_11735 [Chloroflexi bacterium]|nr:hypothetical protein [Chloroflexota bacterium]
MHLDYPDNPLIEFLYWLINTPGLGGIMASVVGGGILLAVGATLRWISKGGQALEPEEFAYPTPALHSHEDTG